MRSKRFGLRRPDRNNWAILIGVTMLVAFMMRLPFYELRPGFEFMFRSAVVFIFAIVLYRDVNRWLGLFLLLALFSHSVPMFWISGFKLMNTPQSYSALNSVVFGCLFFAIIATRVGDHTWILNAICIMATLNLLWLVILYFGGDPYKLLVIISGKARKPSGIMANANESAALMAMAVPAFLRKGWRKYLIIPAAGLVLSVSFGGLVAAGLGVLAYLYAAGYLKWSMILALATVGAVYALLVDLPGIARWHPWSRSLEICWANNPIFGCGLGNWKLIYPNMVKAGVMNDGWIRLHSSFIQGYVEMGAGFVIVAIGSLVHVYRRARPVLREIAIPIAGAAAVVGAMTVNSMFRMNALNAMIAIAWLAILEKELFRIRNEARIRTEKAAR